jgi:hypothetical protein
MAVSRFQGAWLPKNGANGPPKRSATRRDPGDPRQLPDDALEVAEHRGGREDAQHHQVVAFDRHRPSRLRGFAAAWGGECRAYGDWSEGQLSGRTPNAIGTTEMSDRSDP